MPSVINKTADVFGVSRDLPLSYVVRNDVDHKLIDNLTRDKHVIIYGSSKQGKTCLRRNCLNDNDYILVQCQNTWDIAKLSESILKAAGFEVEASHSKTTDGKYKIEIKAGSGFSLLGLGKIQSEGAASHDTGKSETRSFEPLQLDPSDPNDLVRAVWREENRLIVYNGDLSRRVISVDADSWSQNTIWPKS